MKVDKLFIILSLSMGLVVIASNYLVQFPFTYFGLEKILTYGAFSYPITFLITDLANRAYGKGSARKIVYLGFIIGILLTLFVSTNFSDLISIRIAIGSGVAFLVAQNLDIITFDVLRKNKNWYIAPFVSSTIGSIIDTFLFFFISFYGTDVNWITLLFGDLGVKLFIAILMLIPFRMLLSKIMDISTQRSQSNFEKI
tara:strand:+ start:1195 stop:1788 length:594 start_codon:yes stop_codon:yes gene_type:complete